MTKTFSETVDIVAAQSGYQSNISFVATAVNRALKLASPHRHYSMLQEKRYAINNPRGKRLKEHSLDLPFDFRIMLAVRADNRLSIAKKNPGLGQLISDQQHSPIFYYLAGDTLHVRAPIIKCLDIAYYKVLPNFLYYSVEKRLLRSAQSEIDALFEYRYPDTDDWVAYNSDDARHLKSYNRHVNWLLRDYNDVIITGALSNTYNAKGNIEVGGRLFQQFQQSIRDIKSLYDETREGEY